jgi:hypothetical protein
VNALATKERPHPGGHRQTEPSAPALFKPAGSTLEDLVLDAWEDLALNGRADCPVCGNTLSRHGCSGCGSELS